jgi:hypothetical protein
MTIEDNTALVRRLFEALNRGIAATNALRPDAFAPHETFCVAGHSLDEAAHAQFDAMLFTAFPDLQFMLEDLLWFHRCDTYRLVAHRVVACLVDPHTPPWCDTWRLRSPDYQVC